MIGEGENVTIVGGGWSARNVNLEELAGVVIAVNEAAVLLSRWDHAVSMDRLWAENRIDQVQEIRTDAPARILRRVWLRRSAAQNLTAEQLRDVDVFECDHESDNFTDLLEQDGKTALNGRNSGACALNLAFHLKPAQVFLVGFDMNRDPHGRAYWHDPYPWSTPTGSTSDRKYGGWARGFTHARLRFRLMNVPVFNVSPTSAIPDFPKLTPAQFERLTR
jgi:hypothetical protein